MKKMALVFSGYNPRAIVAFLRTLEAQHVPYAIIAISKKDPIFLTGYKHKVVATRANTMLDLAAIMDSIKTVQAEYIYDKYVISPSTEALNRFLLDYRYEFESINCEIPLVDKSLYETVSDKYKFGNLCRENGILTPVEYQFVHQIKLPCVAKPRQYYTDSGAAHSPVIIRTPDELMDFCSDFRIRDFYFQEFIGGESLYLLYYCYRDGSFAKGSQKNLIQQPDGKSIVAARFSDFHETSESLKYEALFKAAGFFGLVMVEIKRYKDKNYMIEANPRFWGPSQLFVDAGVNLFKDYLIDNQLLNERKKSAVKDKAAKFFWYGGIIESLGIGKELAYHDFEKTSFIHEMPKWLAADVYNRSDTQNIFRKEASMGPKDKLVELYSARSKHANYQILPSRLNKILRNKDLHTKTRAEVERLKYIIKKVAVKNKTVLDIGANTGFFSFELADAGAKSVHCYEGNADHADFMELAVVVTEQKDTIKVTNDYFAFDGSHAKRYDITLLLNVLHHIGDDYGAKTVDVAKAKQIILEQLNSLSKSTSTMVFQLGFNWKGDPTQPLFKTGTKQEMIGYIQDGVKEKWLVTAIGIAQKYPPGIVYKDLDEKNVKRDDSLGEFLNRPIFILESKL